MIFATKKDIFYSNEFFKTFIKNNYALAISLMGNLIKYSNLPENGGVKDDFKRNLVKKQ